MSGWRPAPQSGKVSPLVFPESAHAALSFLSQELHPHGLLWLCRDLHENVDLPACLANRDAGLRLFSCSKQQG